MPAKKHSARQSSLFDDPDPASESAMLVTVDAGRAPLSRAQRTFNRLTSKIRSQRAELADWEAYEVRFGQRLTAELAPVDDEVRQQQRRLVARLDALLSTQVAGERLSRRHRLRVRGLLLAVIDEILESGPDPELEALHDKYSDVSREELQRGEMEMMESALSEIFGADVTQGHEATDIDELLRHAEIKAAEQAAAEEHRRQERARQRAERRGGPTKAELAAERRAQAEREASQSIRDIFRKLASALHPDRETDGAERERKTALMQRVNRAYERKDLLELLALQIEIEQIDADQLANAPEERLKHFNAVLREQSKTLDAEIEERVAPFRFHFDLRARRITPQIVDKALTERVFEGRALCKRIERDLETLADRKERRTMLDALPDPDTELDEILAFGALLDADFVDMSAEPMPRKARRKTKTKKKTKSKAKGKGSKSHSRTRKRKRKRNRR